MANKIRLCAVLDSDSNIRRKLWAAIPKVCKTPIDVPANYPRPLMTMLDMDYPQFGVMTELLVKSEQNVTHENFLNGVDHKHDTKNAMSLKTTIEYFSRINQTKDIVKNVLVGKQMHDVEISSSSTCIVGHPDIFTPTQIFEIKTSGKFKTEWGRWLMQLFSYAALNKLAGGKTNTVHLVLPLSATMWSYDISNLEESWPKFDVFVKVLCDYQPVFRTPVQHDMMEKLFENNPRLGFHIPKEKTMAETVTKLVGSQRVAQFFMTMNTRINISSTDISNTRKVVFTNGIKAYVHAPYLLNLCKPDEYISRCIRELLVAGEGCGFKGVVFHVGKSCDIPLEQALANMKNVIQTATEITPEYQGTCKFLLETPAGQGTETLTDPLEFAEFIKSIDSNAVGICVDTCHVFACGYNPSTYITDIVTDVKLGQRLSLIHFNDSLCEQGSKKDRHSRIGCGKIPHEELEICADIISTCNLDAVHE
jgi:endonuclease IV